MIDIIKEKRTELVNLCHEFNVQRLDLFGSAVNGRFNADVSDLDFIIEFQDHRSPGILDRYLDFATALERLFERHVDLLTPRSIRNPYFRNTIQATKETIYDRCLETAGT